MLQIKIKKQFKKDVELAKKRKKDLRKLEEVINLLVNEQSLPNNYHDHKLVGNYHDRRECHLEANWILIYKKFADVIVFERLGTHADLFRYS